MKQFVLQRWVVGDDPSEARNKELLWQGKREREGEGWSLMNKAIRWSATSSPPKQIPTSRDKPMKQRSVFKFEEMFKLEICSNLGKVQVTSSYHH